MIIRSVRKNDDLFQISNIYEQSWKFAYKGIIPDSFLESIPKGKWVNTVTKEGFYSLVMIDEDAFVGTTSYCSSRFKQFDGYGEIVSIYFLPEYMGKGNGKALFKSAVEELSSLGFTKVFLWVLEDNLRARHFYEKIGMKLTDEYIDDNIGGKELREVAYSADIDSLDF